MISSTTLSVCWMTIACGPWSKERGVGAHRGDKDRLCEYACGRNFEVLKWAHNELDLPWAPYPAGRVSDDVLVLRVLRATGQGSVALAGGLRAGGVDGVKMVDGRVVELDCGCVASQRQPVREGARRRSGS